MHPPAEVNGFLQDHAAWLITCYRRFTGRTWTPAGLAEEAWGRWLYHAPFVVLSHDGAPDPVLTYGNLAAQELFSLTWGELTSMPSRFTAEAPERAERERLLTAVAAQGYIDDYSGVRIAKTGQRFLIHQATVWNLVNEQGLRTGQAATFSHWTPQPL